MQEKFSSHRRKFLKAAPVIALAPYATTLSGCSSSERPAGIPVSSFGYRSTAEEVTEGIDLSGKTALVTGCNSGIGYETMRVLALRGAHVYGAGRTLEKAAAACASVSGDTTPLAVELTDFDSITEATNRIKVAGAPLDILICNAGIMELPELEQVNGIEKQFYVNHLGHFVLVNQLLDQVVAAPQGRIVTVSSGRATAATPAEGIEFDNLSGENGYRAFSAYGQSKLANALFSRELARRYAGTNVSSNAVHPGMVATNLGRYITGKPRDPDAPLRQGFKTPDQGAATQV